MTAPGRTPTSTLDRAVAAAYHSTPGTWLRRRRTVRRLVGRHHPHWLAIVHLRVDRATPTGPLASPRRVADPRPTGDSAEPVLPAGTVPPGVTPFVVLSSGRSGSTLLVDELNRRWPEIRSLREEFNRAHHDRSFEEGFRHVWSTPTGHRFAGCKVFPGHVTAAELRSILKLPGMRVVILDRRSALRRYVSFQIARRDGQWLSTRGPVVEAGSRRIHVDLAHFLRYRDAVNEWYAAFDRAVVGLPVHRTTYEQLSADLDGELRRVAAFLGAGPPATELPPRLVRQNPEPLRALVSNFDELRVALDDLGLPDVEDPDDATDPSAPTVTGSDADRPGLPDRAQAAALHLALDPPGTEAAAYDAWIATGEAWTPDDGVRRLFPLVRRRVAGVAAAAPIRPILDQATIVARGTNLRLVHALAGVLDRLTAVGIDALVLKGSALALLHYEHPGDRPMHDLDVLVRPHEVLTALTALREDGWRYLVLPDDARIERHLAVRHSVALVRGDLELDLHWHVMTESVGTGLDDALWAASVPLDVLGRTTRTLGPTDQVLHTVVHGLCWNPVPTIRWVADAHTVITSAGTDLDWRRLADLARRYGLAAPVGAGVNYLADEFPDLVPAAGRAVVASVPVSARARRVFEHGLHPHGPGGTLVTAWYRYRRRVPRRTALGAVPGFVHDMTLQLDLDHAGRLPGRVFAEVRQRLGRSRRP